MIRHLSFCKSRPNKQPTKKQRSFKYHESHTNYDTNSIDTTEKQEALYGIATVP